MLFKVNYSRGMVVLKYVARFSKYTRVEMRLGPQLCKRLLSELNCIHGVEVMICGHVIIL